MPAPYYPGARFTPILGLALFGMDEVLADNFVILDAAVGGGGSSVEINGTPVTNPNFNNTTPVAPVGNINVTWQVNGSGQVSAYVPISVTAPAGSNTQVQYNNSGAFGASANLTIDAANAILTVGATGVDGLIQQANGIASIEMDADGTLSLQGANSSMNFNTSGDIELIANVGDITLQSPVQIQLITNQVNAFGVMNSTIGYRFANVAPLGHTLVGDGTNYVDGTASALGAAGSDTQVQFNDGGFFGGATGLLWDKTGLVLTLNGTFIGNNSSSATPEAAFEFMGAGAGSVFGFPSLFDIIQETGSDWGFTLRNVNATEGLSFFVDDLGGSHIFQTLPSGNPVNGIIFQRSVASGGNGNIRISDGGTSRGLAVNGTLGSDFVQVDSPLLITLKITSYNGVATVANGVPSIYATLNLITQAASIGTTVLYHVPSTGAAQYRLSYYVKVTQAATTSSSVTLTLTFTDRDDSSTITYVVPTPANNATDASGVVSGMLVIDARLNSDITYATTYASSGATPMQYKLRMKAEAL